MPELDAHHLVGKKGSKRSGHTDQGNEVGGKHGKAKDENNARNVGAGRVFSSGLLAAGCGQRQSGGPSLEQLAENQVRKAAKDAARREVDTLSAAKKLETQSSETSGTWKVVHSHPPQMQLVNLKMEDVHDDVCSAIQQNNVPPNQHVRAIRRWRR